MPTTQTISHTKADILYDGLHSGAIGGSVVALFFLVIDAFGGEALFTPSLMGAVLFEGANALEVSGARLNLVAQYSLVHFAVFGALGMAVAYFVHEVEMRSRNPAEVIGLAFVAFEAVFFMAAYVVMPGVIEVVGAGRLFVVNLLAAVAIALFLFGSHHPGAWRRWLTDFARE
jgi:hypothetical protein